MILHDSELIREYASSSASKSPIITPFEPKQVRKRENDSVISYGLSSHGYDIRLAEDDFRIFSPVYGPMEIDPKRFNEKALVKATLREDGNDRYYSIPPLHYALGMSVETFIMPNDVLGICLGKSTYARAGLLVNTTPLEAGWKGRLVVELANTAPLPLRVYVNEGIGQIVFFRSNEYCKTSYADRAGKYQDQNEMTVAKV